MRLALFYNPALLLERLGVAVERRRRRRKLKRTVARDLKIGHIDSLELLELLHRSVPKVIYDIGANVGTWTLLAKAVFPEAEVHCFEPLESHWNRFAVLTRGLSRVHLHKVALGAENRMRVINITNFSDASSLLKPIESCEFQPDIEIASQNEVLIMKLDDYMAQHCLPQPDLMKLDVQGYELEVLRGGPKCLANTEALISEVSFVEYYKEQCSFAELVSFCAMDGFSVTAFGKSTAIGKALTQADVLFLKRSEATARKNR
jgi:FkbM family methyltransferase